MVAVAAGGVLGSLARYGLASAFPGAVTTFAVNVVGCLLIGALMAVPARRPWQRPFLGVGVLGGFTTFSTAMVDVTTLVREGRPAVAALLLVGTAAVALTATAAGLWATKAVLR
ncbi:MULTISPECIES: fluoride efflux transporter FluC [Actinokineospora]|nr:MULTISPECIES: CrcB family protein [Actinokineospora]UVS82357.1 camphor resistance protein CrcB [Actinokineospora sp. UTMC 2448]